MQSAQFDRADRINKKSEEIQDKTVSIQKFAARLLYILVPVLIVAVVALLVK